MISISILLYLSKRGRWNTLSSDLNAMSMTQTPRMCWNKNDARVPALLGATGYDTCILLHSVFPFIISEFKKMILMCFSSDPFNHRLTQFKDSRKFTNSLDLILHGVQTSTKSTSHFLLHIFVGTHSPTAAQLRELGIYIIYFCLRNP